MDEKSPHNLEETKILQQKLQDHFSVSTVADTVSIALDFLGIPRGEKLKAEIETFVYQTGNLILSQAGTEMVHFEQKRAGETILKDEQRIESRLQKLNKNFEDPSMTTSVVRTISNSLQSINIPPEMLPENHIAHFLEEQRQRITLLLQQELDSFRGIPRAMPEDLEEEYFRVDSSDWKKSKLSDGTEILINENKDIIEILEGEFKGEQRFTQKAALDEAKDKGLEIPSNEDWKNIMYWISPEIEFSEQPQEDTRIRTMLNLKLSGASQLGAEDPIRWRGERGHCWSGTKGGYYITVTSSRIEPIRNTLGKYFNPVRCLKKKFSCAKRIVAELQERQNS